MRPLAWVPATMGLAAIASAQGYALWRQAILFRIGDDSPSMLQGFQAAKRSTDPQTRQMGTYYLARYYHRRYEWALSQSNATSQSGAKENPSDLQAAYGLYHEYTKTSPWKKDATAWSSDASFYEAMYYLEKGSVEDAGRNIAAINGLLDKDVYIDEILWTKSGRFAVRKAFGAQWLKEEMARILKRYDSKTFRDALAEAVAVDLRTTLAASSTKQDMRQTAP